LAQTVLKKVVPMINQEEKSPFSGSLKNAIVTNKLLIPDATKKKLGVILE